MSNSTTGSDMRGSGTTGSASGTSTTCMNKGDDRHNEPTRRLDQQVNVTAHSRIRTRPGFNAFEQTRLVLSCSTAFAGDRTELGS
ncbi:MULTISPECIES: hypothetical protein [unclassified Bradyrhizobium]|uniref:hypothetical protein n=1 Tax=unclassified Bradyrhizobium TaxID=2631580 RepID=UPI001FF7B423|nr:MULTISPECIES: hypothetical protein [unclassified Bradyrhizobium]MCK1715848.1 hypothetical protein [Bradyrhizobium sp. 143]MCK1725275.1 hypothetical protein [Bradyrhizobium sp. 142]